MRELVEELIRVGKERDAAREELRQAYETMQGMRFDRQQWETQVREAMDVCDEWERQNGDAPHRTVKLADRIRVNAGLTDSGPGEGA